MKISGRKPIARTTSTKKASPASGKAQTDASAKIESPASEVELSESLHEIDGAKETLATMPNVRVERVQEIKPRVDDGSYKVESKVVAKKMVDASLRESALEKKA